MEINPEFTNWNYEHIIHAACDAKDLEFIDKCLEFYRNSPAKDSCNYLNCLYCCVRYCKDEDVSFTKKLYQLLFPNPDVEYIRL